MAFERPSWRTRSSTIEPLTNVIVEMEEVIVTADIPCADVSKIRVSFVDEKTLEITAQLKRKFRFQDFNISHRRGEFSRYHAMVTIPVPIEKRIALTCEKNILEIRLPRKSIVST
jgi:HSP20 family molecular chaperone IbpA